MYDTHVHAEAEMQARGHWIDSSWEKKLNNDPNVNTFSIVYNVAEEIDRHYVS